MSVRTQGTADAPGGPNNLKLVLLSFLLEALILNLNARAHVIIYIVDYIAFILAKFLCFYSLNPPLITMVSEVGSLTYSVFDGQMSV